jgi:hypothetical protein
MERNADLIQFDAISLKFNSVKFGSHETPWDLRILLWRGGAGARSDKAIKLIENGDMGNLLPERLSLVRAIHSELNGRAVSGRSKHSLATTLKTVREFFTWADQQHLRIAIEDVERLYIDWTDHLVYRAQIQRDLKEASAYGIASATSSVLDAVLGRPTSLIRLSRLRSPSKLKRPYGIEIDRQNLSQSFEFGNVVQDICDALTVDTVMRGMFPIQIPLRRGGEILLLCRSADATRRGFLERYQSEGTLATRHPLANLRIEAEFFMFVAQTGMNVTQAKRLRLRNFRYASHLDGYQVSEVKSRRGGSVLFEIFHEFKAHFERYLAWRRCLFPESDLIFPFYLQYGSTEDAKFQGQRVRKICVDNGIPYVPPRAIRNTRVNWLLRQTSDPTLTAEMAQHTKRTLLEIYERPSLQRALGEVMRFWAKNDPNSPRQATGPGACNGVPNAVAHAPNGTPAADCIRPSGCLWCEHHRDVDSQDYVWSLATFGHLKGIEVLKRRNTKLNEAPATHALNRINEKIGWFRASSTQRKGWVEEAQALIDEGTYHPDWKLIVNHLEGAG